MNSLQPPTETTGGPSRLAWPCGLLYPVLLILGDDVIGRGDEVAPDAGTPAQVAAGLAEKDTWSFYVGRSLGLVSLLFLAVFVAALATRIRRAAGRDSLLPAVAVIGVSVVVSLQLAAALAQFAVIRRHDEGISPEVLVLVLELGGGFLLAMLPMGLVMAAVGAAGVRHHVLGPVLSWSALVLAALLIVGFVAFTAGFGLGFIAMPLSWLWFLAAGVRLTWRGGPPTSAVVEREDVPTGRRVGADDFQ